MHTDETLPPAGLMSIGRFSRATGLSIGALRHYDQVDVLRPAQTDSATGYRSYRAEQVADGRLVVTLKALDLPLEDIREVLRCDDPRQRQELLRVHRQRLQARLVRLQRMLHQLMHLTGETHDHSTSPTKGTTMTSTTETVVDDETQRALAERLGASAPGAASLFGLVRSQLDASLMNYLRK